MNKIKIAVQWTEDVLGMTPGNKELLTTHIASRAPDAVKASEEIEVSEIPAEAEKISTTFPTDERGLFMWDYQWRGYFKEQFRSLIEMGDAGPLSKWSAKKAVDSFLFVYPRRIHFTRSGSIVTACDGYLERPLRAETLQGDRIAIARSQRIKAPVEAEFEIVLLPTSNKSKQHISEALITKALDLGQYKGWGQWRGGGYGRFGFQQK